MSLLPPDVARIPAIDSETLYRVAQACSTMPDNLGFTLVRTAVKPPRYIATISDIEQLGPTEMVLYIEPATVPMWKMASPALVRLRWLEAGWLQTTVEHIRTARDAAGVLTAGTE